MHTFLFYLGWFVKKYPQRVVKAIAVTTSHIFLLTLLWKTRICLISSDSWKKKPWCYSVWRNLWSDYQMKHNAKWFFLNCICASMHTYSTDTNWIITFLYKLSWKQFLCNYFFSLNLAVGWMLISSKSFLNWSNSMLPRELILKV